MGKTTLIVGGTGMLLECSQLLSQRSSLCLLPNRHPETFTNLNPTIRSFYGDWEAPNSFFSACTEQLQGKQVDALIWWCHRPHSIELAPLISTVLSSDCTVVEVIGSGGIQEMAEAETRRLFPGSSLALLGRSQTGWLTHQQISRGVLNVFETGRSRIVGQL